MKASKAKFACTATVGEKGQIVIPKQVREMFGIESGDVLLILADVNRGIAIPPKESFNAQADIVFGKVRGEDDSGT